MTTLDKPVSRVTMRDADGLRRKLVVTLQPGDIIGIREQGRSREYQISISGLYWKLVKSHVRGEE